jgi:hypothetical protein
LVFGFSVIGVDFFGQFGKEVSLGFGGGRTEFGEQDFLDLFFGDGLGF